jgi:type VI secretion system protein ImpG
MCAHNNHLDHYSRELTYLRTESANFALRHPNVARHLAGSDAAATDPHIQHLIESVAFLTASVNRELGSVVSTTASAILDNLCPSLAQPVPSMTIMQMTLDPAEGKVTAGSPVARGTLLSTTTTTGDPCRFQTGSGATLWPLHIDAIALDKDRVLRLGVRADTGVDVPELEVDTLRLHLSDDLLSTMPLHDLLLTGLKDVEVHSSAGVQRLPPGCLEEVGFSDDDAMLANPAHAHPAYALLQKYFAFSRKFHFFDLKGLRGRLGAGSSFSICVVFTHGADLLALLRPDNICLNCVPAINLFPVTSEPIAYDQRHYEYLLVPNRRRDANTEVHSVVSVTVSDPRSDRADIIPSVFADTGGGDGTDGIKGSAPLSWTMRCAASLRPGITGTDVYLAFIDRRDVTAPNAELVIYANLLCTNRLLAAQVTPGTRFYGDDVAKSTVIRALYQPSAQRPPALDSDALWALVSLLRLNHRSLVDGSAGVVTLREMLHLFASDTARDARQISGIKSLTATPGTARMTGNGAAGSWRGHCRGTDIAIEFDTAHFAGASPLMLAGVLARLFALYTTVNSFVRLRVVRDGETWMAWPPVTGRQALL